MDIPGKVVYAGESFYLQTGGRYYQSGRKTAQERLLHRRVWMDLHGPIPAGYAVHHINGDWTDNSPANLTIQELRQHARHHMAERWQDPAYAQAFLEARKLGQEAARAWHASAEGRQWHAEHGKATWEGREPATCLCTVCGVPYPSYFPARSRFCSHACEQKEGYQRHKTAVGLCVFCGNGFVYNKYRQQRCCSRLCANRLRGKGEPVPSKSKAQQQLFGAELSRRRKGQEPQVEMPTETVEEFAATKTAKLPTHVPKKGKK